MLILIAWAATWRRRRTFWPVPECRGAFRSFYILPSLFNSDLDRGFSVASYDLNRLLADEGSLKRVGELGLDLKLDFVLNHLSVLSPQFQVCWRGAMNRPTATSLSIGTASGRERAR